MPEPPKVKFINGGNFTAFMGYHRNLHKEEGEHFDEKEFKLIWHTLPQHLKVTY